MVIRKLLGIILISSAVSACTGRPSTRTEHSGALGTFKEDQRADAAETRSNPTEDIRKAYEARMEISDQLTAAENNKSGKSALDLAVRLAKVVLSESTLSNSSAYNTSEFRVVLGQFHQALILAYRLDKSGLLKSGILKRYEEVSLGLCAPRDLSTCLRLPIFRDSQSGLVMKILAQQLEPRISQSEALSGYYALLHLAYEVSGSRHDETLDQMYVRYAREYIQYLRDSEDTNLADVRRRFRDNLSIALGQLRDSSKKGEINHLYCDFIERLNPLDSVSFAKIDIDKRMRRSLTNEFIRCTSARGRLHSAISKHMAGRSSRIKLTSERISKFPFLYKNLGIELVGDQQINSIAVPAFILESLYYNEIDQTLARSYWSRVGKVDDEKFLKFVQNFARMQVALTIESTLQSLSTIMREEFAKRKGLSSDYFSDTLINANSRSQSDWDELKDRLNSLRDFLIAVYDIDIRRRSDRSLTDLYVNVKDSLGKNFPQHLSLTVTTPMALPMYYYMAKSQGTIKIRIPWLPTDNQWRDVLANDALQRFFRQDFGQAEPLFTFGALGESLSPLQKMHVLDFALRIGIFDFIPFDMLPEDKEKNMPAEFLFFEQYVKDSLGFWEKTFNEIISKLQKIEAGSNFNDYILRACRDPMGAPVSLELSELRNRVFLGGPSISQPLDDIYTAIDGLFGWRVQRDRALQIVDILSAHLKEGLEKNAINSARIGNVQTLIDRMRKEVDRYTSLERSLARTAFALDRQIVNKQVDCLHRMAKSEFFKRNQLMLQNIEHMKNVHAAMSILVVSPKNADVLSSRTAFNASSDKFTEDVRTRANGLLDKVEKSGLLDKMDLEAALNTLLRIHNSTSPQYRNIGYFVSGVPSLEQSGRTLHTLSYFTADQYVQSKWDSVIRVRRMLETTYLQSEVINRDLGTDYSGPVAIARNTSVPLGDFGQLEFLPEYKETETKPTVYFQDQDRFVHSAMQEFAGEVPGGKQYVDWFSTGGLDSRLIVKRLSWMKGLKSLGTIEVEDTDQTTCPKDMFGMPMATKDLSGNWLPGVPHIEECKAIRISAADLTDYYLKILDVLKIKELDREIIELIDRNGRLAFDITSFIKYRNEENTSEWTYFDEFYRDYISTVPVYTYKGGGLWSQEQYEEIRGERDFSRFIEEYKRRISDTTTLFDLKYGPSLNERSAIRRKMLEHLNLAMEFEETVRNLEDQRIDLGDYLIERTNPNGYKGPLAFTDWRVMTINQRKSGSRAGTPIYLSENERATKWFDGHVSSYIIKETECGFLPNNKDPEYKLLGKSVDQDIFDTNKSCTLRHEKWKRVQIQRRKELRNHLSKVH